MFIPAQKILPWNVSITVLHAVATLSTCLRLEHRRRTRRLWWDDWAAVVPAVMQVLNVSVLWLRFRSHPMPESETKALYSYANSFCYGIIIWWSRISLSLAVVRITPPWSKSRRVAITMTAMFILFWMALTFGMMVTCAVHTKWQHAQSQILICTPAFHATIAATTLEVLGDIALIAIPLHQLWRLTHPTSQRHLVRLLFSASILTLLWSLVICIVSYGKFITGYGRLIVWIMLCHIAEALAIITSNLLVLICWLRHKLAKNQGSIDVGDTIFITPHWTFDDEEPENVDDNNFISTLTSNTCPRSEANGIADHGEVAISEVDINKKESSMLDEVGGIVK